MTGHRERCTLQTSAAEASISFDLTPVLRATDLFGVPDHKTRTAVPFHEDFARFLYGFVSEDLVAPEPSSDVPQPAGHRGPKVLVYPGPLPKATDRTSNGDFPAKQQIRVVCVTARRCNTFTPVNGGASITSNKWVQIDAGIHTVQYATLAYGEIVPASALLPYCAPSAIVHKVNNVLH